MSFYDRSEIHVDEDSYGQETSSGLFVFVVLALTITGSTTQAQTLSLLYSFNNTPPISDPLGFTYPGTLAQVQDGNMMLN